MGPSLQHLAKACQPAAEATSEAMKRPWNAGWVHSILAYPSTEEEMTDGLRIVAAWWKLIRTKVD